MFHIHHSSYFQPKIWEVGAIPTTCSVQIHQLQVQKMKFHHHNSKSHNLFNASPTTTIANPTTVNLYILHNNHSSFINQRFGRYGEGQRRRGFMLSIQSKNQLKTCFCWFLPDVLTGWSILPKPSFINRRLGWWNSVGDFDPCMFHNHQSS